MGQQKSKAHDKKSREDLGETAPNHDGVQLILFLFYALCIVIDILFVKTNVLFHLEVKWYPRLIAAFPLLLFGIIIALQSMNVIYYEIRTTPVVVEKGPFRFSRHPMYLSALLIYFAFVIISTSFLGLAALGLITIYYTYAARIEEKDLSRRFQEDYLSYQKRVRKWIDFRRIFN